MNEIELKARVADKAKVEEKLNSFAKFERSVTRDDRYYIGPSGKGKKIRIRKETENETVTWLLTYKKKENRRGPDGTTSEVNEELETAMEDPTPLVQYLEDSGYTVALRKHKDVLDWVHDGATLELCNIPPLGWFLEIEILSEKNDEEKTEGASFKKRTFRKRYRRKILFRVAERMQRKQIKEGKTPCSTQDHLKPLH